MHILINMNYIGFYLCYLLQTAKLINVLSSVLTQLFRKVKEVQRNFPRVARNIFSGKGKRLNCAASERDTTDGKTHVMNWNVFDSNIWIKVQQEKAVKHRFGELFLVVLLFLWGTMAPWHRVTFCVVSGGVSLQKFGWAPPTPQPLALHSSWLLIF